MLNSSLDFKIKDVVVVWNLDQGLHLKSTI